MPETSDSPKTPWLQSLFEAVDRRDGGEFRRFLTEDCEFRFGNGPTVFGREAIGSAVDGFFRSLAGLSHQIDEIIPAGDRVLCHGRVSYLRLNGSSLEEVPFANLFTLRDGLIRRYLIFADISALYRV